MNENIYKIYKYDINGIKKHWKIKNIDNGVIIPNKKW